MAAEEVLILDASVAVKWFSQEPLRDKALALRQSFLEGKVELEAPSLMIYEVANALRYNPRYGSDEAKSSIEALENLQLTIHRFEGGLASSAVETAYRLGITVYDAAYVALAAARNGVMYTADAEVVAKASTDSVKHLAEFGEGGR
ncbi:MAG: type II toxin-antitoxin system VapC family toxin [Nitrososphaerales archaeon]|nr:type II toxin-antitoxin system VapC family toxin [Nitrososphaerales archaeon]